MGIKTPNAFCVMVGLPDAVTYGKFGDDRFSQFCMVGDRISDFPVDLRSRPYYRMICQITPGVSDITEAKAVKTKTKD